MMGYVHVNWSKEEDALLIELCKKYHSRWKKIVQNFPGKQIWNLEHRWNKINPDANHSHFTLEENARIQELIGKYGSRWKFIANELGTNRTPRCIQSKYQKIAKKIREESRKTGVTWTKIYDEPGNPICPIPIPAPPPPPQAIECNEGVGGKQTIEKEENDLSLESMDGREFGSRTNDKVIGIVEPETTTFEKSTIPSAGRKIRLRRIGISSLKQPSMKTLIELADETRFTGIAYD